MHVVPLSETVRAVNVPAQETAHRYQQGERMNGEVLSAFDSCVESMLDAIYSATPEIEICRALEAYTAEIKNKMLRASSARITDILEDAFREVTSRGK